MRTRNSLGLALAMALVSLSSLDAQDTRRSTRAAGALTDWDTVSADVIVQHRRVRSDGTLLGAQSLPVRYKWERSAGPGGWRTVMTFPPSPAAMAASASLRPQDAQFQIGRIEDDGDGTPIRIYNRRGQQMRLPAVQALGLASARHLLPEAAQRAAEQAQVSSSLSSGGRDWIDNVLAPPAPEGRRRELTRRFGANRGRARGLQRFVRTEGDETEEVLADPESALPIEVNVARGGRLVWHGRSTYERDARGAFVRRALHVEQLVSERGDRVVTDFQLANVRVERRGRR